MLGVVAAKRFAARAKFVEGTFGNGIRSNRLCEIALIRPGGMMLPGNCSPVVGSMICALPASEKFPLRSSRLGTVTGEILLGARMIRLNSCENRKNVFCRFSLKRPGIVTGPLTR